MYGFKTLEKKYGITVTEERWWNPLTNRMMKTYNIYSADGCPWEKGLTREGVKKECEQWAKSLISIKKSEQKNGNERH